jgi:hypothetical protein
MTCNERIAETKRLRDRLQHAQQAQHNQDQDHEQENEQDLRHRDHAEAVGNLEKGL